jgi:tryptophan 7-halogenase
LQTIVCHLFDLDKREAVREPIKKVVVAGRDADAWITALFLQLQLAKSQVQVELIELPSQLYLHSFYSVLPTHKNLHEVMGLKDEFGLLKVCGGLPFLAQCFSGWSGTSDSFFHAYDSTGIEIRDSHFLQCWVKARSKGSQVPFDAFSVGVQAARKNKFLMFEDNLDGLSKATQGYNLSAIQYLRALGRLAIKSGVKHTTSDIRHVTLEDGKIQWLELSTGEKITADFFIDASGKDAVLIEALGPDEFESWEEWFPFDSMMTVAAPSLTPVPSFNRVSAFAEGWMGVYPLLNRTCLRVQYSSALADRQRLLENVSAYSKNRIENISESKISTGIRKRPWIGNCVAIGETAASVDGVESTELHLLHLGLMLLRVLFPVSTRSMPEASEFNQRFHSKAIDIRDFQFAHYFLNRRDGEPLWDAFRKKNLSNNLSEKLQLFSDRGEIPMREDQTFQEDSWTALFIGHGVQPVNYNPMVDKIPDEELIETFKKLLAHITEVVDQMPSLESHIEMTSTSFNNQFGL